MPRLFLRLLNVAATFRIWTSRKKDPHLKYVSSHFLTWQFNYIWSAAEEVPLLHLEYIAHCRPHLCCCYYFAMHKKYAILVNLT